MSIDTHIRQLEASGQAIAALLAGVGDADSRWRPADPSNAWSILEIAAHLLDEERRDFRPRLERTLADPAAEWEPIDPERWAREAGYHERPLPEVVADFARERDQSLAWLRSLGAPDALEAPGWKRAHRFMEWDFSAEQILGAWAAHDVLHLRQLAKRLYQLARERQGETIRYAGDL